MRTFCLDAVPAHFRSAKNSEYCRLLLYIVESTWILGECSGPAPASIMFDQNVLSGHHPLNIKAYYVVFRILLFFVANEE